MEKKSDEETIEMCLNFFKNIIWKDIEIPNPINYIITHWTIDPYSYGSYAYSIFGTKESDIRKCSRNINSRIYFGGDYTSNEFMGYVNGAYEIGKK